MKADIERGPRPLRVLFLGPLFSGLKHSLAEGEWAPTGVPAVYRLLEGLAADPQIELLCVFSVKEQDNRFRHVVRRAIAPVGDTVVLPCRGRVAGPWRPLATAGTELEQTVRILAIARRFRPDVVYATYGSIQAAGLLARFGRTVVLRLLGVVPHHRRVARGALPVLGWQLRSPFAHVVSSEDGSDPAAVLPKLLRPSTPWTVRLNGCDAAPATKAEVEVLRREMGLGERPMIVFLGRLEPQKGCLQFTDAANAVLAKDPDCADFVIVGDGPLRAEIEARIAAANQRARVRLAGAQPHARARRFVAAADIYVSTNMYGNLSNANLEAIAAGACILTPTSDPSVPVDTVTDRLVPADAALRYDRARLPVSLAGALAGLIAAPAQIARRRARTAALAGTLIRPWAVCVKQDIDLLKSLARGERVSVERAKLN